MTMKTCRQVERYRFHSTDTTTQRIPAPAQWAAVSCTIMKWKCKSSRTKKRRCACMTDSFTTLRKQTQAMWRKTRRWGFWKGRKTAISLHVIRAWMPCTLIKTERRQGRKTQTKGESHLSVMKEEGWKRRKPIQEASLSMHMTVKACSWKSQTMWAER